MAVGLTVEWIMKWEDHKIDYENLQYFKNEMGSIRIVPNKEKNKIWVPLPELVHDNAIIGETEVVDFFKLGVEVHNEPFPMDVSLAKETLIYSGKENILIVSQRMKLQYRCDFYLVYFPFDETTCDFYVSIRTNGNNSVMMTKNDDSVIYNGPKVLNEFEIIKFCIQTSNVSDKKFKHTVNPVDSHIALWFFIYTIIQVHSYKTT